MTYILLFFGYPKYTCQQIIKYIVDHWLGRLISSESGMVLSWGRVFLHQKQWGLCGDIINHKQSKSESYLGRRSRKARHELGEEVLSRFLSIILISAVKGLMSVSNVGEAKPLPRYWYWRSCPRIYFSLLTTQYKKSKMIKLQFKTDFFLSNHFLQMSFYNTVDYCEPLK